MTSIDQFESEFSDFMDINVKRLQGCRYQDDEGSVGYEGLNRWYSKEADAMASIALIFWLKREQVAGEVKPIGYTNEAQLSYLKDEDEPQAIVFPDTEDNCHIPVYITPMTPLVPKSLNDCLDIQCADGNWNYDSYMHGMANGLLLAKSCITDSAPQFLKAPAEWLIDKAKSND